MVKGPNQDKHGQTKRNKGWKDRRQKGRKGEREKGTKEECNMWRREQQLLYPFNRGGRRAEINYSQKTVPHSEHNPCVHYKDQSVTSV